jgi:hypothetical protein
MIRGTKKENILNFSYMSTLRFYWDAFLEKAVKFGVSFVHGGYML